MHLPSVALLLVVGLGGCITESTTDTTQVVVAWSIHDLQGRGVACPVPVARLHANDVTTDFDCEAGIGDSAALAPGPYTLSLELVGWGTSLPKVLDLTDGNDQRFNTELVTDAGYAKLAWTVDCAKAGRVSITSGDLHDEFPCNQPSAITDALPAGDYLFTIAALHDDQVVASTQVSATIRDRNQVTDLGLFALPIP